MEDKRGIPIEKGSLVAFATLSYKRAHIRVGQVAKLESHDRVFISYSLDGCQRGDTPLRGVTKNAKDVVVITGFYYR